ncbi:MAG: 50S ribosomal protein L15 [Candidatus Paceibacterota bacterium]
MQKDSLKPKNKKIVSRQIGRGGKRGKTSGRGHKGQKARAGRKLRPEVRDFIKTIPKLRGATSYTVDKDRYYPVNLKSIEAHFSEGEEIDPQTLLEKELVRPSKGEVRGFKVKILATGDISKKVTVSNCKVSEAARAKIEKAGGSVE